MARGKSYLVCSSSENTVLVKLESERLNYWEVASVSLFAANLLYARFSWNFIAIAVVRPTYSCNGQFDVASNAAAVGPDSFTGFTGKGGFCYCISKIYLL